jgi:hypothetical protein
MEPGGGAPRAGVRGYAAERRAMAGRAAERAAAAGAAGRGRYGPADCCLYAAALVLALVVVVGGLTLWSLHRTLDPGPPDLAGVADAPSTRAADRALEAATAQQLARVRSATPWAQPLGTSVVDVCHAVRSSAFVFGRPATAAGCVRATTLYLAFDGDLPARLRQLDAVVAALPWQRDGGGSDRGLAAELAARRAAATGGTPPPTVPAGASPSGPAPADALVLSLGYRPVPPAAAASPATSTAREGSAAPGTGGAPPALRSATLTVSVGTAPLAPRGGPWDSAPWAARDGASPRPYADGGSERAHYYAWRPLSAATLAAAAYRTHRHMVAFTLSEDYARVR